MGVGIALVGGTLIDGTGGDPLEDAVVILDGNRISVVGTGRDTPVPNGMTRIDLEGRSLLPGAINTHVHLGWDGSPNLLRQSLDDSPAMTAMRAAGNLRKSLAAGVTTVRDLGCAHGVAIAAREAVKSGVLPGPRIVACGAPIVITGGHAYFIAREVDGPEAVRAAVRQEIKQGADVIKLMATGGINSPGEEAGAPQLTFEEIAAAINEARRAGRQVAAHAMGRIGIRDCIHAGISTIEHGTAVDDETLDLMIRQGIFLVPTQAVSRLQAERGESIGMPAYALEKVRQFVASDRDEHLRRMVEAGVKLAMGTDAGGPCVYHDDIVSELRAMIDTGLCQTPMDVLVASTKNGAELLGWEGDLGTVEPGKLADLVVVNGNPLDDIDAMGRVELVFKDGQLVHEARADQDIVA